MSSNNVPNKTTALVLNQKVTEGVDKYFSKVKSLTVGGTTYTPKALKDVLQTEIDASKSVDSTWTQYQQKVATHRMAKAKARTLRSSLRTYILGAYGAAAVQMLGDFGMVAPKPTNKKTAASKAQAVEKAEATREARNTMGRKQKLLIKGAPLQTADAEAQTQQAPVNPPSPTTQAQPPAPSTTPKP